RGHRAAARDDRGRPRHRVPHPPGGAPPAAGGPGPALTSVDRVTTVRPPGDFGAIDRRRLTMEHDARSSEPRTAGTATDLSRRDLLRGAAALGLGAGALVEAAAPRPGAAQTTQRREFVIAQAGDVAKFDPHLSTAANDIRVTFNLF